MTTRSLVVAAAGATAGVVVCSFLAKRVHRRNRPRVVTDALKERRSMFLQDLNGADAPDEAVLEMLDVANWAPTHGLTQPWRFCIFRRSTGAIKEFFELQLKASKARMEEGNVSAEAEKDLKKFIQKQPSKAKEIAKCSHVIAISMKRKANPEKLMPEWEEVAAVACAVQNAHILACQLGVAAYWSSGGTEGPLATQPVREMLGLEDGDRCLGLMYVGMADEKTWRKSQGRAESARGSIDEKVSWL